MIRGSRVVVIGSGIAGLTAARRLDEMGHVVTVLDKGRQPGGRLATRTFDGGAMADYGAQFFTTRSELLEARVAGWLAEGTVLEWCRGFTSVDGHPRYAAAGGIARLAGRMASGLDVRQSVRVESVQPVRDGWVAGWPAAREAPAGAIEADAVVLSAPVPQSGALLAGHVSVPELTYDPTLSLLVALDRPPSIPAPGGVQLTDHATWSWIADNVAKGVSRLPSVTLHTRSDVAAARWEQDVDSLTADLLSAARPWLQDAEVLDIVLHRWRYATPKAPYPKRCWTTRGGRLVLAGDAFGGPRVEGAFLSGLAAASAVAGIDR